MIRVYLPNGEVVDFKRRGKHEPVLDAQHNGGLEVLCEEETVGIFPPGGWKYAEDLLDG